MAETVVVGISGGVDSSVAAYLLKKQGYNVIGITMNIWQSGNDIENAGGCCGLSAADDARSVCCKLGIKHYVLNFKNDFKKKVVDYFINSYLQGLTPNPCIACNNYIKWEKLLNKSLEIGADYIATGHYAKIVKHPKTDRFTVKTANTQTKDQTYALCGLTQSQLSKTFLPIGDYDKNEIRKIAAEIGLEVADKPDSQDICFVPDGNYYEFIKENSNLKIPKGNFVDYDSNICGEHKGICAYTIGQRKGLGIAFGKPMYICELQSETNEVVIGKNEMLFKNTVLIKNFNYMAIDKVKCGLKAYGKLRYSQKCSPCRLYEDDNFIKAVFDNPQRAVTPGQFAVFYDEEGYVLGGGEIMNQKNKI